MWHKWPVTEKSVIILVNHLHSNMLLKVPTSVHGLCKMLLWAQVPYELCFEVLKCVNVMLIFPWRLFLHGFNTRFVGLRTWNAIEDDSYNVSATKCQWDWVIVSKIVVPTSAPLKGVDVTGGFNWLESHKTLMAVLI